MKAILSALLMIGLLAALAGAQTPAPAQRIKFGIQTGQQDVTYKEILATWKEAEALGFDSAWNFDHFMPIRGDENGPCLEAWTLLGALATQTSRLRIGSLVTGNTYRNPALLAKMATTVDRIGHGRTYLGIGASWFGFEHEAYGIPFYSAKQRAERLGEALHGADFGASLPGQTGGLRRRRRRRRRLDGHRCISSSARDVRTCWRSPKRPE